MRITSITVFKVDLPIAGGEFHQSGGRVWRCLDSTVVRFATDVGIMGWGESCPFGPNYIPAFAEGVRGGIEVLAPGLIGQDPRGLQRLGLHMDTQLYGTPSAKTAIDNACWDILGKATGLPVFTLLGGRNLDDTPTTGFFEINLGPPAEAAVRELQAGGCDRFEFKASGDPRTDIEMARAIGAHMAPGDTLKIDVNGGWRIDAALRVAEALSDVHVLYEQPCASYEECLAFKTATGRPVSLDECIHGVRELLRAIEDKAIDVLNLKIGRVGGLSKAKLLRDLCVAVGIPMYIQDTSGGEFNAAATAHLAQSTPPGLVLSAWDCAIAVTKQIGQGLERNGPKQMRAPDIPGMGVEPDLDALGKPVAVYGDNRC